MKPQHRLAAIGLVAGLAGGGAAGMALGLPGFAGAQTGDPSISSTAPADPAAPAKRDRAAWMRDALAPLVEKDTITQAQADAVIAALDAAKPAKGGPGHGHRGGPRAFGAMLGRGLDTAAGAIGISVDELRTALRDGQSVADVAKSKGVDSEKVVSALVGQLKTRLDEAVAAGRITQAQADEKVANATEPIRAFVNGAAPFKGGFGPGRKGHRGPRPDGAPTPPNAEPSSLRTTNA